MKKIGKATVLFLSISSPYIAFADVNFNSGNGDVRMNGAIIETPCAIAMESIDQTVAFDTVPVSTLKQWGQGPRKQFTINIIGCRLPSEDESQEMNFGMTFDGPSEKYGFSTFGSARGVALQIDNEQGQIIWPGQPIYWGSIVPGDRQLKYGLRLVSNHSVYKPGDFQSIIRFKLNYY
ncbi:fimbrial protein [Providencia sp. Me31A]|uniref:fimbrial protein n=1 Tax=Providencia sp. Me31A TaxID=3392637 RepID=UPI003D28D3AE